MKTVLKITTTISIKGTKRLDKLIEEDAEIFLEDRSL
jgi:hypothetical protein